MKWSTKLPTVEGWYLRANPPIPRFQKHYLLILDVDCGHVNKGELGIHWPVIGGKMMRVSDIPKFYWLGPLPKLPTEQLRENIGSTEKIGGG